MFSRSSLYILSILFRVKKGDIEYYDALVFKCASDQTGIVTRMRSQRSRSLSGTLVCEMKSNTWSREMLEQIGGEEGREEGCEKNGGSGGREKHTVERMRNRESREERERERGEGGRKRERETEIQTETENGGEFESGKTG